MTTKLATIVADFTTNLATAMAVGATGASLQSATDDDGIALPNGTYFFAIDGNNSQKEHIVATLTGMVLSNISSVSRQGVQTSGVVRTHRVGSTVTLTDFAHIKYLNDLLKGTTGLDSANPLSYDGTADMTGNDNKVATVAYVKGIAIAGSPDATTTTKGISKASVAPVSSTSPIFVGDNDPRVPTQNENDAMAGTSGTAPSSANKFVDNTDTSISASGGKIPRASGGKLDIGWLPTGVSANQLVELDGSAKLPAVDASQLINLGSAVYACGTITDLLTTTAQNNDAAVTTPFQPRIIKLTYWIQGHTPNSGTAAITQLAGVAIFAATTLLANIINWLLTSGTDNTGPASNSANLSFGISPSSASSPTTGTGGGSAGGISITLSITSITSTGFTIRRLTALVTSGNNARASIFWEAFA